MASSEKRLEQENGVTLSREEYTETGNRDVKSKRKAIQQKPRAEAIIRASPTVLNELGSSDKMEG